MSAELKNFVKTRTKIARTGLVALLSLISIAAMPPLPSQPTQSADPRVNQTRSRAAKIIDSEYVIGPSDVLAVNVWRDSELSRTVLVRPDGKISLPLVGELEVSGLTASKVQQLIVQKLDSYISKPQVAVIVTEVKSRTYIVVGKVARPGSFELDKPTTVLEAIAIAGGFVEFAKLSKIYVIRRGPDGAQNRLPFNYKKVLNGREAAENIELQPGDTVVVP